MEKERFTIRIKPFPEESLYSFMMRFAIGNGISFLKFWNAVKQSRGHFVQMNDVRLLNFAPVNVIDPYKMAFLTGLDVECIFKMSLYYAIKRFCGNKDIERARFFSYMLRDKLYYCPDCLHEHTYHKLLWSIEGIDKCIYHNTSLINKCPNCGKEIMLKDLCELSTCPNCGYELGRDKLATIVKEPELKYQKWLYNTFNTLLLPCKSELEPWQIAMRILFILNRQRLIFDRGVVEEALCNKKEMLPTLLQHARESLSNKRTLHFSFLLSVLYENSISLKEFLDLEVPENFIASVRNKTNPKKDEVYCMAPWCKNYMKKGSLVKTGTPFKRKNSGEVYKYYLTCLECGCEYAFDENNELKERTYFIKSYYLLNNLSKRELGLKELSLKTGLSQEMVRRCLSYFESRRMFTGECNRKSYSVDEILLHKFIEAVKAGININQIKKWPVWKSYNHFLFYRFHKDIAKEINIRGYKKEGKNKKPEGQSRVFIKNLLERMISQNIDITIKNVCKEASVCPETLRYWGCNGDIAQAKSHQKQIRIIEKKNEIYLLADQFLQQNNKRVFLSGELYSFLGIRRNLLWRFAPEITARLSNICKEHNKKVEKII